MKRLLAAVALAAVAAGALAGPAAGGAVPLDGWNRTPTDRPDPAPPAAAGTAQDAALGLHAVPEAPPAPPWSLLAVAALALGYVLTQRRH